MNENPDELTNHIEGYPLNEMECLVIGGHCWDQVTGAGPHGYSRTCRHCGKHEHGTYVEAHIEWWED